MSTDKKTTIAGIGVAGSIIVGLWDQIDLLLDDDPVTGSWKVVVALGVAIIASTYWAYMTNKDRFASSSDSTEKSDPPA